MMEEEQGFRGMLERFMDECSKLHPVVFILLSISFFIALTLFLSCLLAPQDKELKKYEKNPNYAREWNAKERLPDLGLKALKDEVIAKRKSEQAPLMLDVVKKSENVLTSSSAYKKLNADISREFARLLTLERPKQTATILALLETHKAEIFDLLEFGYKADEIALFINEALRENNFVELDLILLNYYLGNFIKDYREEK